MMFTTKKVANVVATKSMRCIHISSSSLGLPLGGGLHGLGCSCCTGLTGLFTSSSSSSNKMMTQNRAMVPRQKFTTFDTLTSDDDDEKNPYMRELLQNNRKWVEETNAKDPQFFAKLAQPQRPKYLYIGCSDSRVPANEILGLGPGEVFVHRNIGNLVPGNDLNALSVLEYAVSQLNINDIIVTGHYDCGAVRAASMRQDLGTLENWLRQIRDVYRLHKDYLDLLKNEEQRHHTLVELNVIEQCLNIYKTGIVQRKRIQTRKLLVDAGKNPKHYSDEIMPRIHGMVFNPKDGKLKKLPIDFKKRIGSLDHIYGLY